MKYLIFFLIVAFNSQPNFAHAQNPSSSPFVNIIPQIFTSSVENKSYLTATFQVPTEWYLYWKNPGSSGISVDLLANLSPFKFKPSEIIWPIPSLKIYDSPKAHAYALEGEFSFFIPLSQEDLSKEDRFFWTIKWLACKEICLPGERTFKGQIKNQELILEILETIPEQITTKAVNSSILEKRLNDQNPREIKTILLEMDFQSQDSILFKESVKSEEGLFSKFQLVAPLPHPWFDFGPYIASEKTLMASWSGQYAEPSVPFPEKGLEELLKEPKILKQFSEYPIRFLAISPDRSPLFLEYTISSIGLTPIENKDQQSYSLFLILILAFLGGLILNIMPCVLPVVSLKLYGLLRSGQHSHLQFVRFNLGYTGGVLFSFLILSFIFFFLRLSGERLQWGIQLQSPFITLGLMGLLFVMALNIFGVFEWKIPSTTLVSLTGKKALKDSPFGSFLEGILAVILSTPCSAPFLSTALSFAFLHSNAWMIILILFVVGLGLSFPFILLSFFPSAIKFLPRPGNWMNVFKVILGIGLLLTIIWLYDLFISLNYSALLPLFLFSLIGSFFVLKKHSSGPFYKTTVNLLSAVGIIFIFLFLRYETQKDTTLNWAPWNKEMLNPLIKKQNWSFIDVTAKWCLTCQANKIAILETKPFSEIVKKYKIELFRADWTKPNKDIEDFLISQKIVGIPAYFLITPNKEILFLGTTFFISDLEKKLKN